jgi:hypothetical protein
MKLLRNVSVKISDKSLPDQLCSFIMYSAADYVEMLIFTENMEMK